MDKEAGEAILRSAADALRRAELHRGFVSGRGFPRAVP